MTMTLTAEQLSVVNLVSGCHLVLAPPGSGKTEMLSYFKLGVSSASDERALPLAAMGDFIYHRKGEIRLEAATALDERGVGRWQRIVRGASSDFARLQTVDDDAHEESIRAILAQKLPDEYERRLRAILHARAKRKT